MRSLPLHNTYNLPVFINALPAITPRRSHLRCYTWSIKSIGSSELPIVSRRMLYGYRKIMRQCICSCITITVVESKYKYSFGVSTNLSLLSTWFISFISRRGVFPFYCSKLLLIVILLLQTRMVIEQSIIFYHSHYVLFIQIKLTLLLLFILLPYSFP